MGRRSRHSGIDQGGLLIIIPFQLTFKPTQTTLNNYQKYSVRYPQMDWKMLSLFNNLVMAVKEISGWDIVALAQLAL